MNKKIDVTTLRTTCPLPNLLQLVGLGEYAKSRWVSPFSADKRVPWGLFQYQARWMYKDGGTGELGDEIGLLARINKLNPHDDFGAVLKIYQDIVNGKGNGKGKSKGAKAKAPVTSSTTTAKTKPNATGFGPGTYEQIEKLAQLRGISVEELLFAQERGVLVFGSPWGFEVYAVRDQSGRLIEARCLNGNNFGASGDLPVRPSQALSGSQMDWPLGILEAKECDCIALVAGSVEFLTLHQYVVQEKAQDRVAPVAMLSSARLICPDALEHFKGKHVRIYPSQDKAGIEARDKWGNQLHAAGARKIEFFNFSVFQSIDGHAVKDLCEFNRLKLGGSDFAERHILP
jgi:hypothetical protein